MSLWKVTDKGLKRITETNPKQEKMLEEKLEDWIAADPTILGEPLLILGRQVIIPDTKDRLDLLAADPQGNTVIIELKRGKLKDPVDMQALRYASYISKWRFEDFENILRNYNKKVGDPDFNFISIYEEFCEDAGIDEVPDLNKDQRTIIVGSSVKEKLGSVALWLFEHGIDIKVIEIQIHKDGDDILIEPNIVVPPPINKFADVGGGKTPGPPWIIDGKSWHLNKRCSEKTKEMFVAIDEIIQQNFEINGPIWKQKHYIAYRVNNYNWLIIITAQNYLRLDFLVKANSFKSDDIASRLKIAKFDIEETLSEKFGLPSSVLVKNRNENTDRISLRVKDDFNVHSDTFLSFLKDAYKAFPKVNANI
jgi:hypothetical protein